MAKLATGDRGRIIIEAKGMCRYMYYGLLAFAGITAICICFRGCGHSGADYNDTNQTVERVEERATAAASRIDNAGERLDDAETAIGRADEQLNIGRGAAEDSASRSDSIQKRAHQCTERNKKALSIINDIERADR